MASPKVQSPVRGFLVLASCMLIAVTLAGCGGGGGGGGGGSAHASTAPTISNPSFSPSAVYVNAAGGTQSVHGEFDFADPDGDLASLTLKAFDEAGHLIDSVTSDFSGVAGLKSGTIAVDVDADTSTAGRFTIRVTVTDRRGLVSNELTGLFRVSEFPWVARAPMPFPRREFATAAISGKVYVLGGGDTEAPIIPSPATTTVQVYDPATDTWATAAAMPVATRNNAASVVNGKIYVVGGESNAAPALKTLQVYDPVANLWSIKADMPYELRGSAAAGADGLLFVFGGDNLGFDTANTLSYEVASDTWSSRAAMLRAGRDMAAVTVDGKPLVLGGYGSTWTADAGYYRLVQQYDATANTWTERADMYIPRSDFAVAVVDGTVYVAGGGNWDRGLEDLSAYDVAADRWSAKTPMPQVLAWPRAETLNGKMYVFDGGSTLEYTPSNDIM
jgi:N-acetylneuraminic acid mutarotase